MTLDLARDTIFLTLGGSRAYGTAHAGSDIDVRGVCVAPLDVRVSLFRSFEQHEGELGEPLASLVRAKLATHPTAALGVATKTEHVVFDVAKLLRLAAAANPNALEILFTSERDWLFETPAWRTIHAARRTFLSHKAKDTYLGYALAQLRKIERHRNERSDTARARRNPARAALESEHGYDTKHAMHLVRLLRTGIEVLRTGDVVVRRPDADELVAIRDGALSFDVFLAKVDALRADMDDAIRSTALPVDVDYAAIDALALSVIRGGP